MNFGSQDQERHELGKIANLATRYATVEHSLVLIYNAVPESVREQAEVAPREVRPAPIAPVIESADQTAEQPAATITSLEEEARRRVQQEAQPAQSINVYPEEFGSPYERDAA